MFSSRMVLASVGGQESASCRALAASVMRLAASAHCTALLRVLSVSKREHMRFAWGDSALDRAEVSGGQVLLLAPSGGI